MRVTSGAPRLSCPVIAYFPLILGPSVRYLIHSVSCATKSTVQCSTCECCPRDYLVINHGFITKINVKFQLSVILYFTNNIFRKIPKVVVMQEYDELQKHDPCTTDNKYNIFNIVKLTMLHKSRAQSSIDASCLKVMFIVHQLNCRWYSDIRNIESFQYEEGTTIILCLVLAAH